MLLSLIFVLVEERKIERRIEVRLPSCKLNKGVFLERLLILALFLLEHLLLGLIWLAKTELATASSNNSTE